ncbi:hypothetical protein PG988_014093 [Apiospora saccharicola]
MALFADPQQLQEQTQHILTATTSWAAEIQSTLAGIKGNTSQVFFWSMFAGLGVAATVTLWTLNRLHDQLKELNYHQVVYRDMWIDERNLMHRQIRATEDFQYEELQKTQQQWGLGEKNKREIMTQMLRNQQDLNNALAGGASAAAASRGPMRQQVEIPRRGDPGYEEFREDLINFSQAMYLAKERGDRGSGSNGGMEEVM